LARRESVNRAMVVRQKGERIQIAVLEDGVLVEHYVTRGSSASMVGNVYLGRVQNVLPSMEAAFVDIGRGRNAVLYAGEVNWDAAGLEGQPKRIEFALKSGDPVLVQVTKDPVGQKGARLTSQISLPGRFLVYVPDGSMTGISRKLPDTERSRLKGILKRVMPEDAGVIVRTAAEGAPEEALEQDVLRLTAQWAEISKATKSANPPALLYSEPDLAIKVVRDIFNEDVTKLVVSGDTVWTAVSSYIGAVAPDLVERLDHYAGNGDVFAEYRVEEQLMKALDRKVYLPSGGSLVIDRTEAMTVVDVNTGKFTGQGGNLEQTVTRNNIEAAEEIVRQLRLRDIGGIIVVDFIDMVLESNRDLVLRRLVECLGRDRTKHQVAEVTSLGLVQMTRKRIGSGLLESFSETCEHCNGRGIRVSLHGDHDHGDASPKYRRPANAVDPADVAARALAAHELRGGDEAEQFAPSDTDEVLVEPVADIIGLVLDDEADDVAEVTADDILDDIIEVDTLIEETDLASAEDADSEESVDA
jgi:ribonuclease E